MPPQRLQDALAGLQRGLQTASQLAESPGQAATRVAQEDKALSLQHQREQDAQASQHQQFLEQQSQKASELEQSRFGLEQTREKRLQYTAEHPPSSGSFEQQAFLNARTKDPTLTPEKFHETWNPKSAPAGSFEEQGYSEAKKTRPTLTATQFHKEWGEKEATAAQATSRLDNSFKYTANLIEKGRAPVDSQVERIGRLKISLDQNSPQADSLVAPELLTAMAGGQGSGLRMNEAEISRIVGGRNVWENLKSKVAQWQLDPSKPFQLLPEQRKQVRALVDEMSNRLGTKQGIYTKAYQDLIDAPDVASHRKIFGGVHQQIDTIDNPSAQGGTSKAPRAIGDKVTIRGKQMTITVVHPDGTFDAK